MINQQRMILAQSVNGSLCARIIPFCQVTVPVLKTLINDELIWNIWFEFIFLYHKTIRFNEVLI